MGSTETLSNAARQAELFKRVLDRDGTVVMVVGSGCSFEETDLPTAEALSEEVHNRLVIEGHIAAMDDPTDLGALAEAVESATGSIELVVDRIRTRLSDAPANAGHLIAAALMIEGAISSILTINFDMCLTDAMRQLGVSSGISEVRGKRQISQLGSVNLIYLHGTVESPAADWVLTDSDVNDSWDGHWREALARRVLTAPVVVFAGVGTSVGALVTSLEKIEEELAGAQAVLLVQPGSLESSDFFEASSLTEEAHLDSGWLDFTRDLGDRMHALIVSELYQTAQEVLRDNRARWPEVDLSAVREALERLGLVAGGKCRGRWVRKEPRYMPWNSGAHRQYAQLALAVARIAGATNTTPQLTVTGGVLFDADDRSTQYSALLFHGGGTTPWATLLAERGRLRRHVEDELYPPTLVIGGGFTGPHPSDLAAAEDLTGDPKPGDLVEGPGALKYVSVDDVMVDPNFAIT